MPSPKSKKSYAIAVYANGRVLICRAGMVPKGAIECFLAESKKEAESLVVGECRLSKDNKQYFAPGIGPYDNWRTHNEDDLRYFKQRLRVGWILRGRTLVQRESEDKMRTEITALRDVLRTVDFEAHTGLPLTGRLRRRVKKLLDAGVK